MYDHDVPEGSNYVPGFNPITDVLGPRGHAEMLRNAADKLDPPAPYPGEQFLVRRYRGPIMLDVHTVGPLPLPLAGGWKVGPFDDKDDITVEIVRIR